MEWVAGLKEIIWEFLEDETLCELRWMDRFGRGFDRGCTFASVIPGKAR
jgi:hypothetical protein